VQGSQNTVRGTKISQLTQWLEVSPMELKLSIEMQQAMGEKVDYAKENSCCICMTDLYEGIQEMTIDQVKDVQRKIIDEKTKNP
jgi:uncharacterized protein YacL (UPF0231 family)